MKVHEKILLFLVFIFFSSYAYSDVKIENVNIKEKNGITELHLVTKDIINFLPDYEFKKNELSINLPKIEISNNHLNNLNSFFKVKNIGNFTTLTGLNQISDQSKFRIDMKNKKMVIFLPGFKPSIASNPSKKVVKTKSFSQTKNRKSRSLSKENLDEEYLSYLIDNSGEKKPEKKINNKVTKSEKLDDSVKEVLSKNKMPEISSSKSNSLFGTDDKSSLTFLSLKFLGILVIVLGLFFLCIKLFKTVMLKKGQINFFKNPNIIQVLEQAHLGPKKSIILLKVHDQLILVSNSDQGVSFITEVDDPEQALNEAMKKIDHQNFDNQVNTQEKSNVEDKVVLKNQKNLMKSKNTNAQKLKDRVSKIKSYV